MLASSKVQILSLSLVLGAQLVAACATDDTSCSLNDTRNCICAGGAAGAQSCDANGKWGACNCGGGGGGGGTGGGGGGGGGGGTGGGGGGGGSNTTLKHHGDICTASAFDCGSTTNLVCIVDHPGDSQGSCRLACSTFAECLNNADARAKFDTSCCDVGNGTMTCGNSNNWPEGTCH